MQKLILYSVYGCYRTSLFGPYWEILVEFFFCKFKDLACGSVHKRAKKNETNIFPVRTGQASSIKFLLLWLYFFKFPGGTAPFIGDKTRA